MNYRIFSRLGLAGPMILALAACGAGSNDDFRNTSPIRGVSVSDLETQTDITNREPRKVSNAVAIINNIRGDAKARIVIRDSQSLDDGSVRDAAVFYQLDQNGDGVYDSRADWASNELNLNPEGDPISHTTGKPYIEAREVSYGDAKMAVVSHIPDLQERTTVYVPARGTKNMYGGMYVTSRDSGPGFTYASGAVATWGRKTTSSEFQTLRNTELSTLDGQASYRGVAEAIVDGAGGYESGLFRDEGATGTIDFARNTITMRATNLQGIDSTGARIGVTTGMTYNADGSVNRGSSTISGLTVGTITGSAKAEIYGPNAETMGGVFSGNNGAGATVVGGMILNRTDD